MSVAERGRLLHAGGDLVRDLSLALPPDEEPVPDLAVQQQPQAVAVIRQPGVVGIDHLGHRPLVQHPVPRQLAVSQENAVEDIEVIFEHVRQRRGEALLLAGQQLSRQVTARQLDLYVPQGSPAHLQPSRQPRGELRDLVVHERTAGFQAMRHRHAILDHHGVIGQARLAVGVQHAIHGIARL